MKFPNSLIQSMMVSQHTRLRTPLCLAALAAMLFAGAAWGQQPMTAALVAGENVPIDSSAIYPADEFTLTPDNTGAAFGDASPLDDDTDGIIDSRYADLDEAGPNTVGIVDWVIVEFRIVAHDETDVPTNGSLPGQTVEARSVSKTALLRNDGYIVDPDNLDEDVLTLEDVDFDPETESLYIVVDHRNHVAAMSAVAVDDDQNSDDIDPNDGVYNYDFTTAAAKVFGSQLFESSEGASSGSFALYGGDADRTNSVISGQDGSVVRADALRSATGYLGTDIRFDARVVAGTDLPIVSANALASVSSAIER